MSASGKSSNRHYEESLGYSGGGHGIYAAEGQARRARDDAARVRELADDEPVPAPYPPYVRPADEKDTKTTIQLIAAGALIGLVIDRLIHRG